MKLAVLCPHFAPDTAPTGEVITRIVTELAARGHELHVVTALPWYRHHAIEPGWGGKLVRTERTHWGSIRRVHPFPTDKRSIVQRAAAFGAFSALAGLTGLRGGKVDGVLAMSPPLTLGLTGWGMARLRRGPLVFNIQDVFPDVAVELGAITNRRIIAVARWLERTSYKRADAVTILSDDLRANLAAKLPARHHDKLRVIPNFVDTELIIPRDRMTDYRRELGLGDRTVVLYAGNVGLSQSLELVIEAARRLAHRDDVVFLINGGGSGRPTFEAMAEGLDNVRFGDFQPKERLAEVLATGDIHVVPLKKGLAASSVPSKTYSILAAGRPLLASIDPGTEVERVVAAARCGTCVPPDDAEAFVAALTSMLDDRAGRAQMGAAGRSWVEQWASPAAVAEAYEALFEELRRASA
ncbi:MAG: glycosyltransferase family 4 protein [Acidimicrobiia bacterium]